MAQNIFDATLDPNNEVKINNFDWQHANNFTTKIGAFTPIFCDLLPAHSEFRVKSPSVAFLCVGRGGSTPPRF